MAYYTDAYNVGGTSYVQHLGHAAATKTGYIDGLLITGTAYNAAADLISGQAGQLSYGDAGPQIRFTDAGQKGAIIFSRFDASSGMNAAFHFVTDDGSANAAVKADGLIARTRAMIGGNSVNNSYTLYVNGNTFQNGIIYGRATENYIDGKLSGTTGIGWRINPRLGIGVDPSTSYHLYVNGPTRINNDLTIYREGTTAQNYPARIYLSNKDTTTGKIENVTIEAYNSHTSEGYGAHLYVQTASSIEIYAGDGANSAIKNLFVGTTANSTENLWLGADDEVIIYSSGDADRVGIKVQSSGHILPWKVEAANTNVQTLGASGNRWKAVYIGTADTYGSEYEPIWWNSGVPTKVTDNALLVNLGAYVAADTDETYAASVWRSKPRPGVYGILPTTGGGTGNNTFTATRLVYSNTATKLATGNIVSNGNYISKVTYLTINGEHQTTNRLYVNGSSGFNGDVTILSTTDATSIEASSALWVKGGLAVDKKAYIGDDLMLYTRDADRSIIFGYDKNTTVTTNNGASWRLVAQGHGTRNANFFSLQSSRSVAGNNKTWNDVARFGMDKYDAMFGPYGKIILDGVGPIAAGTQGETIVAIGNNIATATANNGRGRIRLFGTNTYFNDLMPMDNTANRWYHLPITPVDDAYLVGAWKRESTTSAHTDLNTLVDTGFYSIPGGFIDNGPGAGYGSVITGGYRKPYGNTASDHSFQIFVATGGAQRIHFRTSKSAAWEVWRELAHIANNTKTGDTNKGVYVAANGVVTAMTYTLDAKIDAGTANRIAWYKGANEIASGTVTTDGAYLGAVSYLSVNTAHQTTYRFRVNGISYFSGGNVIVADTLRPEATRKRSLGLADYYWNAAWIYGNGNIHENALYWGGIGNANVTSTDYSISTASVERGITAFKYPNGILGNRVFGFPAEYTTVQYTADGGNSWADVTDPWYTADRIRNLFNFNETQIPVGNLDKFDFTASQTTSPCSVGMGVQVTADFTKDNRVFYLNAFETYWRAYCCTCICRVEIYRANTSEWITLREDTITNSDTRRFVHLGQNWYCDGGRTNRNGTYFNKMRWTILVTAVGTSNTRYVPSLGVCNVYGINGGNFSAGNFTPSGGTAQVSKYGTRMAWSMMRFNSPIYVSNYNNGGLGEARVGAATLLVGDDLRWTAAGTDKYSSLILGNNKSIDNEDAHSRGCIYIYNNKTGYNVIYSAADHAGTYSNYFGKASGYIAIGGNGGSTGVGSATQPVYLDVNGVLQPCSSTLGSYLPLSGGTMSGNIKGNDTVTLGAAAVSQRFYKIYLGGATSDSKALDSGNPLIEFGDVDRSQRAQLIYTDYNNQGGSDSFSFVSNQPDLRLYAPKVHNAVWNDYAECRIGDTIEPGYCVTETETGCMTRTKERLMPGCKIISDTYGSLMGETLEAQTPIAVAGRVLVYPTQDRNAYPLGAAVCSGPNGTVDLMTREEIIQYPERIVGTVSEIPQYEVWEAGYEGRKKIQVNGRIWIYVR